MTLRSGTWTIVFTDLVGSTAQRTRIGDRAAEIIHIGQAVLTMGATIEYFRDTVFNYPTLAEAYKVAALNGLNRSEKHDRPS